MARRKILVSRCSKKILDKFEWNAAYAGLEDGRGYFGTVSNSIPALTRSIRVLFLMCSRTFGTRSPSLPK